VGKERPEGKNILVIGTGALNLVHLCRTGRSGYHSREHGGKRELAPIRPRLSVMWRTWV
jgi:hypothetical protein